MPIVAKSVLDARRAAAEAPATAVTPRPQPSSSPADQASGPPQGPQRHAICPRTRAVVPANLDPSTEPADGNTDDARRAAAGRDDKNYAVGYGKPPLHTRFAKGSRGGPGRPKGVKNHDTLLKDRFEKKRAIKIDGVERIVTQHELLVDLQSQHAMKGKEKPQQFLLGEAKRLYSANDDAGPVAAAPLSPSEQALFDQLFATLNLTPMVPGSLPEAPAGSPPDADLDEEPDDEEDEA